MGSEFDSCLSHESETALNNENVGLTNYEKFSFS
jgi:hypothetical protein